MMSVIEYSSGKPQIKRAETFCSLLENKLPQNEGSFSKLLKGMDKTVISEHPDVKTGALSNCHGDWYEWLIAILANNYSIENKSNYLLLQLPNISQLDVFSLYTGKLFNYI